MMRPLQVYLDSSDFSVLSDPSKRTREIITLESQLIKWRDDGLIEIRFAYPHLIEAAPMGASYIDVARCRAKKIDELCQGKALAAQDKIIAEEIKNLIGEPLRSDYIFMNDGDWLPDFSDSTAGDEEIFDYAKQIRKSIVGLGLSSAETKRALKQFLTTDGRLRPRGIALLKENIPETVSAICEKYPVDAELMSKFAHKYLRGDRSVSISDVLFGSFRDLPNFIEWFARQYDQINPTVAWLRESGDALRNSLLKNRQEVETIYSDQKKLGIGEDVISAKAKESLSAVINGLPRTLLPRLARECSYSEFQTMELRDLPEKAPSLFAAISVMGGVIRKTLQPVENERAPKISDMGDVIHCLYLPHVDFFRTDRFVSGVIKEIKLPFATAIVGSLRELPDAIRERLADK